MAISEVRIVEVSDTNRKAVIRFTNRAFLWEFCAPGREIAQEPRYMEACRLLSTRYWIMTDEAGRIIGVTGIDEVEGDAPENCFLGFFILDRKYLGKGLGKQLLAFTEEQARLSGKKKMRVLTSTFIPYAGGRALYSRSGYKIIATKDRHLKWRVRKSVVLPESVRRAVSDQYSMYLRLGFTATCRKKNSLFPHPVNRMLIFEKDLNS